MEIRTSTEVGIKRLEYLRSGDQGPPVENPAGLPGTDTSNRQKADENRAISAVRPTEAQKTYAVTGAMIDERA